MAFYSALRPARAKVSFAIPAATYRNRFAGFRAELKALQRVEESRQIEDAKRNFVLTGDFETYKTFLETLISGKSGSIDPQDTLRASQLKTDLEDMKIQQNQLEYNTLANQLDNNEISGASYLTKALGLLAKMPPGKAYESMKASIVNTQDALSRKEKEQLGKQRAVKLDNLMNQFMAGAFDRTTLISKLGDSLSEEDDPGRKEDIKNKIVRQNQELVKDVWSNEENKARDGAYTPVQYVQILRELGSKAKEVGAGDLADSAEKEADNLRNNIASGGKFTFLDGKSYGGQAGPLTAKGDKELARFETMMNAYERGFDFYFEDGSFGRPTGNDIVKAYYETVGNLYDKYGPDKKIKIEGLPQFTGEFTLTQFKSHAEGFAKLSNSGLLFDVDNDKGLDGNSLKISDPKTPEMGAMFISAPDGTQVPIPIGTVDSNGNPARFVVAQQVDGNGNISYVAVPMDAGEEVADLVVSQDGRLKSSGNIGKLTPVPTPEAGVPGGVSEQVSGGESNLVPSSNRGYIGRRKETEIGVTTSEGIQMRAGEGTLATGGAIGRGGEIGFGGQVLRGAAGIAKSGIDFQQQTMNKIISSIAPLAQKAREAATGAVQQAKGRYEAAVAAVPPELRGYLTNLPKPNFEQFATGLQTGFEQIGSSFISAMAGLGQKVTQAKQIYAEEQRRRAEEEARRRAEEEARAGGGGDGGGGGGGEQRPVTYTPTTAAVATGGGVTGSSAGGGLGRTEVTTSEGIKMLGAPLTLSTGTGQGRVQQEEFRKPSWLEQALGGFKNFLSGRR